MGKFISIVTFGAQRNNRSKTKHHNRKLKSVAKYINKELLLLKSNPKKKKLNLNLINNQTFPRNYQIPNNPQIKDIEYYQ